jgi:hypothetical protein
MFDIAILKGLSDSIGSWVDRYSRRGERIEEREKIGLQALCRALNETRLYVARLERAKSKGVEFGSRDHDREAQLSNLWTEAAPLLKRIDSNLAQRCLEKAEYWADPESWSFQEIKNAGIGLERVHQEAKKLLGA